MPRNGPLFHDEPFEQLAPQGDRPKAKIGGLSLKARAVGFLSRREHSRLELERKLAPHADDATELKQVLDQLEHDNWLSNQRFAQTLVNRRAQSQGTARIIGELRQHGLTDEQIVELRNQLQGTELQRARQVWEKKFSHVPENAREYAKQFRFLASRGFSPDCLRRIIGDIDDTSLAE